MKRFFLFLCMTVILGCGVTSCADEEAEIVPTYKVEDNQQATVVPDNPPKDRD
jgi:predicted small metal-binding protein